jgi:hypothetical protein
MEEYACFLCHRRKASWKCQPPVIVILMPDAPESLDVQTSDGSMFLCYMTTGTKASMYVAAFYECCPRLPADRSLGGGPWDPALSRLEQPALCP